MVRQFPNPSLERFKKCERGAFNSFPSAFLKPGKTPEPSSRHSKQHPNQKLIMGFMTCRCIMNLRNEGGSLLSGIWQLYMTLVQCNTKIILCENTAFSVVSFVPGKGIYHVAGLILQSIWREW